MNAQTDDLVPLLKASIKAVRSRNTNRGLSMAKKTTTDSTTPATPRTRVRKPAYYIATLTGDDAPTVIVAKSFKVALSAVVSLKVATAQDLMDAGKNGHRVIDTTATAAA